MSDSRFIKARQIAELLLEIPPGERQDVIDTECSGDDELRREVLHFIAIAETAVDIPEDQAEQPGPSSGSSGPGPQFPIPKLVGGFEIIRMIASGGWSIVYEARQSNPERRVAIKILHASLNSSSAQQRFAYESQVLARLKHPGIAEIYEAGSFENPDGQHPYFAMEFIEGARPLDAWANEAGLDIDARLALISEICDIAHYGHTKGVIHCDLKPGNILVDADSRVRVIDFGIAMAVEEDASQVLDLTDTGRIVGTLQYMAPEQFDGEPEKIDARTDVHAMGVLLYQLLTGRKPWSLQGLPLHEAIRAVRTTDPVPASEIVPSLEGDLQTIIEKAMSQQPDDRYPSTLELRQDIERFRAAMPIQASPPSMGRVTSLFLQRHRTSVAIAAAVALALCGSLVLSLIAWRKATIATSAAETSAAEAQLEAARATSATDFLAEMFSLAHPAVATGGVIGVERMLDEATAYTETAFRDDPQAESRIRLALARIQLGVGDLEGAKTNLDAQPAPVDENAPGAIEAAVLRAHLEHVRGDLDQAEARLQAIIERYPDSTDPSVIDALGRLARVRIEQIDYEPAAGLLQTAIARANTRIGADDARTIELQAHLGRVNAALVMLGSPNAPEPGTPPPYGTLSRVMQVLGPTHPATYLARLAEMDHAFIMEGLTPGIIDRLRSIHQDAQAALGPMHPRSLETTIELANLLRMIGERDESESMLRSTILAYDATLGPGHSHAALGRLYLGQILLDKGDDEEAVEVLGGSWQVNHAIWGSHDPRTIDAEASLALALLRLDQVEDGLPRARSATASMETSPMHGRNDLYWSLRRELVLAARRAGREDLSASEAEALRKDVQAHLDPGSPLAAELMGTALAH